ncbi:MAG TPA: hypothetical protein VN776_16125 [Terracidiphilus sp.]|nr:hypothetical protein [Terracidiphilus sp.]
MLLFLNVFALVLKGHGFIRATTAHFKVEGYGLQPVQKHQPGTLALAPEGMQSRSESRLQMFGEFLSAASRKCGRLHEATIKRGALFYVLFWGVCYWSGLMLAVHIYFNVFRMHQSWASTFAGKTIVEYLLGGLFVGTISWLMQKPVPPSPPWQVGLKKQDLKNSDDKVQRGTLNGNH